VIWSGHQANCPSTTD